MSSFPFNYFERCSEENAQLKKQLSQQEESLQQEKNKNHALLEALKHQMAQEQRLRIHLWRQEEVLRDSFQFLERNQMILQNNQKMLEDLNNQQRGHIDAAAEMMDNIASDDEDSAFEEERFVPEIVVEPPTVELALQEKKDPSEDVINRIAERVEQKISPLLVKILMDLNLNHEHALEQLTDLDLSLSFLSERLDNKE